MQVLVFVTQHMPTGGIESHLQEFCRQMSRSGVEIDLVVTNSCMSAQTQAFYEQVCRRVYLCDRGRSTWRIFWLIITGLKLNLKNYDALYTNGQGESLFLFSKLLYRIERWVHHHHTAGDVNDQSTWGVSYRKALLSASAIIACSSKNANLMEVALQRKVHSIPCFSRQVEVNRPVSKSGIRFGYYGRLIPEKGIDILCKLSEDPDLKKIEFHIWGEGEAYPASHFDKYSNLQYHGVFSGVNELSRVIASLDAFLLISKHPEGLPICLLEAMSAGLPWIATDQGGIRDIALDPCSTRVIPVASSYTQIKDAVLLLASDIQKGKITSNTQKALYNNTFSYSALVSRWTDILNLDVR